MRGVFAVEHYEIGLIAFAHQRHFAEERLAP
jgi:hypothetical protein